MNNIPNSNKKISPAQIKAGQASLFAKPLAAVKQAINPTAFLKRLRDSGYTGSHTHGEK